MKLVRSDSPEVIRYIASTKTRAGRHSSVFLLGLLPNLLILSIALVSLIISVRAAAWIGLPAFLAWNAWVLWRTRYPRLSWVIKARPERVYIRLFVGFGKAWRELDVPDVIVLETSEIASISIRTVEVFLYGPKPKLVEWLMIEPAHAVAESVSDQIPLSLWGTRMPDLSERVYWANEERRLAVGWESCRPALRLFLQRVVQECPSIVVGPEERSELDLNGIWHGHRENLNAQERQKLVQATRLGFGCDCAQRISQYKHISFRKAGAYLAEIVREEAGTGQPAV
jgi:hypothetical protein